MQHRLKISLIGSGRAREQNDMRTTAQTFAVSLVTIALVTTLILPKRQSPAVINAFTGFTRGNLATAMGTGKQV